jgi:CheY-like chemotaxis protein
VSKPILIVDDSHDDATLLERMLRARGVTNPIFTVHSALEAIAYLEGDHGYEDRTKYFLPKLILLDLKMPLMDGFEFMGWLRLNDKLGKFKVIVVSGLADVASIRRAYALGARSFLIKPYSASDLENLLKGFPNCWTLENSAPENQSNPGL